MRVDMNALAHRMLKIMESTPLRRNAVHLLRKQCKDVGVDFEKIKKEDVHKVAERLRRVLPFFIGEMAVDVVEKIEKLGGEP